MIDHKKFGGLVVLAAFIALLAVTGGCGNSVDYGPTFKVTPVKGNVTLAGAALPDAEVILNFQGTPPKGFTTAAGKTDAQGNFEILTGIQKGAPAGQYKVTVSKLVGPDGKPVVPTEGMDLAQMVANGTARQLIPPEFSDQAQSTTEVTVADGTPTPDVKIAVPQEAAATAPGAAPQSP
jgi:hypothetical protein